MGIETVSSWRELDEAIADTSWQASGGQHVHATLVFRGLARASYPNVSSLCANRSNARDRSSSRPSS